MATERKNGMRPVDADPGEPSRPLARPRDRHDGFLHDRSGGYELAFAAAAFVGILNLIIVGAIGLRLLGRRSRGGSGVRAPFRIDGATLAERLLPRPLSRFALGRASATVGCEGRVSD